MKPEILSVVACPECASLPLVIENDRLHCRDCSWQAPLQASQENQGIGTSTGGIPILTPPPPGMAVSEKIERNPDSGTPWRQANWRFLKSQLSLLSPDALILDVGAGRGDFAEALSGRRYLELEVYPYPEVDIVCDLTRVNPFLPESFDAVLLLNVLEHIYDTRRMLTALAGMLKPNGVLIVAIPFMVKLHQIPVDYVRYTEYALGQLGEEHGLRVELLEGYYDPIFFLGEGIGNLRWSVLPHLGRSRRYPARLALAGMRFLASVLARLVGPGKTMPVNGSETGQRPRHPIPTGYQIVYRKPA